MTTKKKVQKKGSDADKAMAKAGTAAGGSAKKHPSGISLDTVLAEKDEVKQAEENLRERKSSGHNS